MYHGTHKRSITTLYLATLLFLCFSGIWVYKFYQNAYDMNKEQINNLQTIRAANQTLISINQASLAVSDFLLTGNNEAIKKLPELIISAQLSAKTLRQLIDDNATEITLFTKFQPLIDKKIEFLQNIISLYQSGDKPGAVKLASDPNRIILTNDITTLIININKMEVGQIEQGLPTFQLMKIEADKFLILLGLINIFLLLVIYVLMKIYSDKMN